MNHVAGIILAGGHSRRMGTDKAMLKFGLETLLQRLVRIAGAVVSPVVVVAAQNQSLPPLPPDVLIARDANPGRGPLEGMAAGIRLLQTSSLQIEVAFVTGCDTPLLFSEFISGVIQHLDLSHEAAVPQVDNLPQPLAGVYRVKIMPVITELLASNSLSLQELLKRLKVRFIQPAQLRDIDPQLLSLRNLNTPADYHATLAAAGMAKDNQVL